MELLTKRLLGIMGQAPNWLYGMTDNGRNYFKLLDTMQSFTAKVFRDKKAEREKKKLQTNGVKVVGNQEDTAMGLSEIFFNAFISIQFQVCSLHFTAYILFKLESRKAFLDKLLDTAEETGDFNEENILNQVDTFMFAVKII